jgi:3-oxoacyl-(acyl-carrier-protein) synthase
MKGTRGRRTSADEIDHVNAHGTSTPENDKMEALALGQVLGSRASTVPVTSNKSQIGHTLIAAGAVEAVISLMTIAEGVIPPTINYDDSDPEIGLDIVANNARSTRVRTILSNSIGFGGQNACLVPTPIQIRSLAMDAKRNVDSVQTKRNSLRGTMRAALVVAERGGA